LLYRDQGRYAEAEPLYRRALALREQALGPTHPDVATSLNSLGLLYHDQGRYAEAEPLYQRAIALREQALGPTHPTVAQSLNGLAVLYQEQGRYAEAEPRFKQALMISEKTLGLDHPKSGHMRLVHLRGHCCVFLRGDLRYCRGDRRLIVEV
jgi:tetratricopeptide (TPR) repeat protein